MRLDERSRELGIMSARTAAYCDDGQSRARDGIVPEPNTHFMIAVTAPR